MAVPSSQVLAIWVKETIVSESWVSLRDECSAAAKSKLQGWSEDAVEDLVEKNLPHVAEHLRNDAAEFKQDGAAAPFEIDDEQSPYIRVLSRPASALLARIRQIDPFEFEQLCASILQRLGAQSETTQRTNDGGVDFLAIDFDFVPDGLATPLTCRAAVIGQAKRYKDGNAVPETAIRSFIGGGMRWRHKLACEGKIGPLSPTVFAFWTTSSFEPNARLYARAMGVWYMEGRTLAEYCAALGLEQEVDALLAKSKANL